MESACRIEDQVNAMTSLFTAKDKPFAGDSSAPKCPTIEIHLTELKRLLDAIDPLPFRDQYPTAPDPDAWRADRNAVSPRDGAKDDRRTTKPSNSGKLTEL